MCLILINIFCNSDGRISPKINPIQNNYNSDVVKVIVKKELSVFRGSLLGEPGQDGYNTALWWCG